MNQVWSKFNSEFIKKKVWFQISNNLKNQWDQVFD